MKTIYLAGGCFWGVQRFFDQFDGVEKTTVGYANGHTENPSYEELSETGHAETVKIEYEESVLSTPQLLKYYFMVIDPLSVNRQGYDFGTQYRTGIYYTDEELLPDIRNAVREVEEKVKKPLAVEVLPLNNFYDAEDYHQKYLENTPGGYCHIPLSYMTLQKKLQEEAETEKAD